MNESFVLRFKRAQQPWSVQSIVSDGLIFDEPDPVARRLVLDFHTPSDVTELRLDRIRALQGWRPWEFRLLPFINQGRLGFRGVEPNALPPGDYQIKLRIEGLTTPKAWSRFRIHQEESTPVDVAVATDNRSVVPELQEIDARIARVLQFNSPLDGAENCLDWLGLDLRPTRKACLLNILGQLRVTPSRSAPLVEQLRRVLRVRDDRVYGEIEKAMYDRVRELALDPSNKKFYWEGEPHALVHLELLEALPPPHGRHSHRLESYRAEGSPTQPSLQAVFAIPKSTGVSDYFAEFDIDLGNPLRDIAGFAIHIGELVDNKPTNHLDLRDKLKAAKDFLYYSVVGA